MRPWPTVPHSMPTCWRQQARRRSCASSWRSGVGQDQQTKQPQFAVTNVNSHSLGIRGTNPETGQKKNKVLIPKSSRRREHAVKQFKTFKANQSSVVITVLEGESEQPEVCTQIGVYAIRPLPTELPAGWPVQVTYSYESNGRLHVSASVKGCDAAVDTDFQAGE